MAGDPADNRIECWVEEIESRGYPAGEVISLLRNERVLQWIELRVLHLIGGSDVGFEVEDCVALAVRRLYQALAVKKTYKHCGKFRAYVRTIAAHVFAEKCRPRSSRNLQFLDPHDELFKKLIDHEALRRHSSPPVQLTERRKILERLVPKLRPIYRDIIVLKLDGCRRASIVRTLRIKVRTYDTRFQRAKKMLGRLIDAEISRRDGVAGTRARSNRGKST